MNLPSLLFTTGPCPMRNVKFLSPSIVKDINAATWQICSDTCHEFPGCNFWQYDSQDKSKKCLLISDYFDIDSSSTHLLGQSKSRMNSFFYQKSTIFSHMQCEDFVNMILDLD